MAQVESFQELRTWQEGMDLAEDVYRETVDFPKEETFGLTSQMRRAVVSIPSNIVEGWGRENTGEYIQFLKIAKGSSCELMTQTILAKRLGLWEKPKAEALKERADALAGKIHRQIRSLQRQR